MVRVCDPYVDDIEGEPYDRVIREVDLNFGQMRSLSQERKYIVLPKPKGGGVPRNEGKDTTPWELRGEVVGRFEEEVGVR